MAQVDVAKNLAEVADLALAGQKNQNISRRLFLAAFVLLDFIKGTQHAIRPTLIPVVFISGQWPIAHVHRIGSAAHLDHGRLVEELAEALDLNGGRRNDDLQIRAFGQKLAQVAQQKIDVETALVGFVDDDRIVAVQKPVVLNLRQQDTVGHHLYTGLLGGVIGKTNLIPDLLTGLLTYLLGNTGSHTAGGDPPGLGMTDQATNTTTTVHADFGYLGGFARTGFTRNDYHLMVFDGLTDIIHTLGDRKALGEAGRLVQGMALLNLFKPALQPVGHFLQVFLARFALGTGHRFHNAGGFLLIAGVQLLHHRSNSGFAIGLGFRCARSIGTGVCH